MADLSKEKIELYFFNIITDKRNGLLEILIKVILFGLSCVYRVILEIRYICFKMGIICSASTKVKVISIGNITVGGTGKTPLVEAIIEKIGHEKGKVAVITRGYKKDKKSIVLADEPQMLKETFCELPVIINKDRIAGIDYALKHYQSQWVVLDDAFGNLSVKKDLNIVCIDCNNPFGNGHLLPRGIMRLPFSYLKEADVFVLTSSEIGAANIEKIERKLKKHNKKAKLFKANHVPQFFNEINSSNRRELDYIQGKLKEQDDMWDTQWAEIFNEGAVFKLSKENSSYVFETVRTYLPTHGTFGPKEYIFARVWGDLRFTEFDDRDITRLTKVPEDVDCSLYANCSPLSRGLIKAHEEPAKRKGKVSDNNLVWGQLDDFKHTVFYHKGFNEIFESIKRYNIAHRARCDENEVVLARSHTRPVFVEFTPADLGLIKIVSTSPKYKTINRYNLAKDD